MIRKQPAPVAWPHNLPLRALTDRLDAIPPDSGTGLEDRDGDVWVRGQAGWMCYTRHHAVGDDRWLCTTVSDLPWPSQTVAAYGPFNLIPFPQEPAA